MGALVSNLRESKIGQVIGGAFGAFLDLLNAEVEENTLDEVIKKSNDPQANKIKEALMYQDKMLEEQAAKQFNTKNTFGKEDVKDKDGCEKIKNKLEYIVTEVSEVKAIKESSTRAKGGRQQTRVDED